MSFAAIQFTIYEKFMGYFKIKYGEKEFKEKEMKINVAASFFAGGIAAGLTNPLECITVNKQTNMDFNIK